MISRIKLLNALVLSGLNSRLYGHHPYPTLPAAEYRSKVMQMLQEDPLGFHAGENDPQLPSATHGQFYLLNVGLRKVRTLIESYGGSCVEKDESEDYRFSAFTSQPRMPWKTDTYNKPNGHENIHFPSWGTRIDLKYVDNPVDLTIYPVWPLQKLSLIHPGLRSEPALKHQLQAIVWVQGSRQRISDAEIVRLKKMYAGHERASAVKFYAELMQENLPVLDFMAYLEKEKITFAYNSSISNGPANISAVHGTNLEILVKSMSEE